MSHHNATSPIRSGARESTTTATTEKYPASSQADYQSYPEVAPIMSQPPLEHSPYQQQHNPSYAQSQQYQYQNGYTQEAGQPVPQKQKRNPWGMSPLAFGLLVAGITAVIVGGAVGGGVAGAMSGDDDKSTR